MPSISLRAGMLREERRSFLSCRDCLCGCRWSPGKHTFSVRGKRSKYVFNP